MGTIDIDPETMQQSVLNKTSTYHGVCWDKFSKKWKAQFIHQGKTYYGGLFDNEEHAAMNVNLLCDKYETERKNPTIKINLDVMQLYEKPKSKMSQSATENIVNEKIKVEDENMLEEFKDQCENNFMEGNDKESFIDTASCQSQKRKRKEGPIINDVKVEEVEIATSNDHVEYELVDEIPNNYTKIQD